jgi:hypothetical protein
VPQTWTFELAYAVCRLYKPHRTCRSSQRLG